MFPQGSQERHNFINWMFRVIIGQYYRLTLEVSNVNNVKVVARGTGRVIFSVQILVKTDVLLYMQICTKFNVSANSKTNQTPVTAPILQQNL